MRRYAPGGWAEHTLPVNVFLFEHPAGLCLFDTGQTARAALPGHFPRWHPFFRLSRFELAPGDEAAAQLAKLGVAPGAIRWVVLSHLHTDHAGGVADFAAAELIVSNVEWARASGIAGRIRGYLPQHWPDGLQPRLVELAGPPIGPFAGSFDLTGDGTLTVVPLPGHTPGHVGLLARLDGRGYLAVGDLVHTAAELAAAHPAIDAYCAHEGITVLAAHDDAASLAGAGR